MKEFLVIAEHRRGELIESTLEALALAKMVTEKVGGTAACAVLGQDIGAIVNAVALHADSVYIVEHETLKDFNSDAYEEVLAKIVPERKPFMLIMAHTSTAMELAPRLAARLGVPLATDCVAVNVENDAVIVTRQVYGGKVEAKLALKPSETYFVTIRPGTFKPCEPRKPGRVVKLEAPPIEVKRKRFMEYVEPPVAEVDITKADIIVSVGRGIRDAKNIPMVEELAELLGGVLACSRPVVDKGWLPKDRQVGSSGKTVKPKLYLVLGISGAFQHVVGMKSSELIIAVNKDPKAPIFQVAHYGVVDDLFKVVPALKEKLKRLKSGG